MNLSLRRRKGPWSRGVEPELVFEAGVLFFAAGLAAGIGALVLGRATASARHTARRTETPPSAGSVPAERHENVATVAAR